MVTAENFVYRPPKLGLHIKFTKQIVPCESTAEEVSFNRIYIQSK